MPPIPDDPSQIIPPPEGGGWGWAPVYGWGWFPMSHGSMPPQQPPGGGETPPDPPVEPPGGGGGGGGGSPPIEGVSVLLFEDTFQGGKLNQDNWWTRYIYTGPDGPGTLDYLNDEVERFRESGNQVFAGGRMASDGGVQLTALPQRDGWWYPSGMLRSKELFDLAGGKRFLFECRAKVPAGKGVWPAFWLSGDAAQPGNVDSVFWPPEIDIMEIANNTIEDTTWMCGMRCQVLDWDRNPQRYTLTEAVEGYSFDFTVWYAPFDFAADYHTFQLLYERPNITFLCDGAPIVRGTYDWVWDSGEAAPPAHVLCNLAIGGNWAGRHGIDDSAFPQSLDVEFIRVWCSEDIRPLPKNTIGHDYEIG
jgi:hypothetical protein